MHSYWQQQASGNSSNHGQISVTLENDWRQKCLWTATDSRLTCCTNTAHVLRTITSFILQKNWVSLRISEIRPTAYKMWANIQ